MAHCLMQFSSKTGPISRDAQHKGEFKISNTRNLNHTQTTNTLNFSGKVKHELRIVSYEVKSTSCEFKSRVKSPNPRVMRANP